MNAAATEYVRVCPVCGAASAPDAAQCEGCGTLLLGVDLSLQQSPPTAAALDAPAAAPAAAPAVAAPAPPPANTARCPHPDCAADNPPGRPHCLYCDRPLAEAQASPVAVAPAPSSLYRLPAALADKFAIVEVLPAGGAEAEIMILAGKGSGVKVVAKIYRPGIVPQTAVLERVSQAAFRHVVQLIAHGVSEGVGYELMEYCAAGSLRQMMPAGGPPPDRLRLRLIVGELAEALAALHELHVIHRDLKPENVLIRRLDPLDLILTDFGIASITDATQLFTGMARSVKYGAPETLAGVLDYAADYWSLGMILVELLSGRHPFDGLSDAVITHRLVTGSIDLDVIDDADWRGLCRGLLLRDPQRRWGLAEIRRWLDGDASLIAPQDEQPPLAQSATRPYRIEAAVCQTPAELAVALATHWPAGRKDLMRGQLSAWVGQDLKDDNLLRFIHDLLEQRDVSDDLRLARLIRHLAPALPPVWRGDSLAVANLLARAAQAEQGDAAAADWLVSVYAQKVLRELAPAQHPAEAALAARWTEARERFERLWLETENIRTRWRSEQTSHAGVADFDALVFGQPTVHAPPPPARIHPSLLLALADDTYASALRRRIQAEAAPWLPHSPWLGRLLAGDEVAAWVVASFLVPHAQSAAEEAKKRQQRDADAETAQLVALALRTNQALALLRDSATDLGLLTGEPQRDACFSACQTLHDLMAEARASDQPEDTPLLRTLRRAEPIVLRIQERLDAWAHAARINAVWRNRNLLQGIFGGLFFLIVFGVQITPVLLLVLPVLALVAAWFFVWKPGSIRGDIGRLAKALPLRVPAAAPVSVATP